MVHPMAWWLAACGPPDEPQPRPADTAAIPSTTERDGLTWYRHVRPLLHHHCSRCHDPGGVADDIPLDTYAHVLERLDDVVASVASGRMPPDAAGATEACQPRFAPVDDAALDAPTVALLATWAADGAPLGDPAWFGVTIPPVSPSLAFWSRELTASSLDVPVGEAEWCFAFDPAITTRRFVTALEVLPSAPDAVLEAVVIFDAAFDGGQPDDGSAWACEGWQAGQEALVWHPGDGGLDFGGGEAWKIEPSGRVVLQVRYRTAVATVDAPTVRLVWQDADPTDVIDGTRLGTDGAPLAVEGIQPDVDDVSAFLVPAGAAAHTEAFHYVVTEDKDAAVLALWPGLFAAGVSVELWVDRMAPREGEPASECLLGIGSWSMRLQRPYRFDVAGHATAVFRKDDVLRLLCRYDNTVDNLALMDVLAAEGLDAPVDLPWGRHLPAERCTALVHAVNVTGEDGWPAPLPPVTEPPGTPRFVLSEVLDHREVGVVKAVEIANVGDGDGTLDGWTLHRWANGSVLSDVVPLDGVEVAAGGVAVAVARDGLIDFLALFDRTPDVDHPAVSGNGDDAYALVDPAGAQVDVYGEPGVDGTDTAWEYTDGVATRSGDASGAWDPASWTVLAGSASASPGTYDPAWVGEVLATTPQAIQTGLVAASTEVSVTGLVVSAVASDGVFAQAATGGPNAGLWLYLAEDFADRVGAVSAGDVVDVVGVADEYDGTTQVDVVGDPRGSLVVVAGGSPPSPTVDIDTVLLDAAAWESVWVLADGAVAVTDRDASGRVELEAPGGAHFDVASELWPLPFVSAGQGFDVLAGPLALRGGRPTVLPTGPADFVSW